MFDSEKWLLLLYRLPTRSSAARVSLWRQLKKAGALSFKSSVSLLPDSTDHFERFQWIAQQVRDAGGEATLIRVTEIEGLDYPDLVRRLNDARAKDYDALSASPKKLIAANKRKASESFPVELDQRLRRFEEIRKIDFFRCPRIQDAQMLLERAGGLMGGRRKAAARLAARKFVGRTWLTRPRPQIDRVGSAWLIRRFIDAEAKFIFAHDPKKHPGAIPYQMYQVEFSHHGDD